MVDASEPQSSHVHSNRGPIIFLSLLASPTGQTWFDVSPYGKKSKIFSLVFSSKILGLTTTNAYHITNVTPILVRQIIFISNAKGIEDSLLGKSIVSSIKAGGIKGPP